MKRKAVAPCRITFLSLLIVLPLTVTWAHETTWPGKELASIFPNAEKFVEKKADLTPEKVASIEAEIGAELRPKDLKPTFYVAINEEKKPMGLVLFVDVEGPNGIINGSVGLDMKGKVVKVEVYKHQELPDLASDTFLKQFIGKGVEDKLEVGKDIEPIAGQRKASQAIALMPKKTLTINYALFLKGQAKAEEHAPETIQPEDLHEVMGMMKEEYNLIRTYFQGGEDKAAAVQAAKQLGKQIELIADFEPPKNPNNTEEYAYFRKKFHEAIHEFAQTLDAEGVSQTTQKQWQDIIDLVNKAHLRFSVEEVDLDED